jgi:hypothetical protein
MLRVEALVAVTTTNVLSLGSFAELDTNENTTGANNANLLVGQTFGSTGSPLWGTRVRMTMNDGNNNGTIPFTNKTPSSTEYIAIGNPAGPPRSIDAGVRYNATITYWDGTTATGTVRILQDGQGNLFVLPPPRSASQAEISAMTAKPIASIRINSVAQNDYVQLETSRFGLPDDPSFPCFAAGTLIRTPSGDVAIETLRAGDLVLTADGAAKPLRWIGSRRLGAANLAHNASIRPIRIRANALGAGQPSIDLVVSPQHRMLIRSKIAQKMFAQSEVLVAAKHLCQIDGVAVADDLEEVVYYHLLLDRHEIIHANGAATESLLTGAEAIEAIGSEALAEIRTVFPELSTADHDDAPARPLVTGRRGRQLASRHLRNAMPLIQMLPNRPESELRPR